MRTSLQVFVMTLLTASSTHAFSLEEQTISGVQQAITQHEITCKALVERYLDRIKQYNLSTLSAAPINAFTEINPSVIVQAEQLDHAFEQTGKLTGALHCIPVILKDNIDSYDTTTTAGSYALLGNQPTHDADFVKQLRQAGAIIIGKGGMDEFAWGMFGFSSRSGRIGNVYHTDKNPGGSSGGTGAAVSANFAMIGIGSDNSGSVRIPSIYNGITGLRPTAGLISLRGMFPMGNIDGTAGPMARTTTDLAKLLDVIANPAYADKKSYASYLNTQGLQHKRIGIVKLVGKVDPYHNMDPVIQRALDQAIDVMKQHGTTFVEIKLPQFNNDRTHNQAGEIEDISAYLQSFPAVRKDFRDICESDRTRNFGNVKACLAFIKSVPSKADKRYKAALDTIANNKRYVENVMKEQHLDALLLPVSIKSSGSYDGFAVTLWQAVLSSNAGLPAIDFVIGHDGENMPIGIDLTGQSWHEGDLIAIAYAFEQLTHLRKAPALPQNDKQLHQLSIPQFNNLIAAIGKRTYDDFFKNAKPGVEDSVLLPAATFRELVAAVQHENLK